jgi:hypothetical protein
VSKSKDTGNSDHSWQSIHPYAAQHRLDAHHAHIFLEHDLNASESHVVTYPRTMQPMRRKPRHHVQGNSMHLLRVFAAAFALSLALVACHDDDDNRVIAPTVIAPATIASGIVGVPSAPIAITADGTAPVTFTVQAGTLPPGLSLSANGLYAGTPTTAGTYSFTIRASNAKGSVDQVYSPSILQRPSIDAPASPLANSVGGVANSTTFTASGSTPITWSVSAGALPPGMTLDAATGVYAGTPTSPGNFTFTITATNSVGADSDAYTQFVTTPAFNAHALINGNSLAAFPTSFPAGRDAPMSVTGLLAGDTLASIDRRPQNGFLYGLGFNAVAGTVQLYSIAPQTGVATAIGTTGNFVAADGVTPVPVGMGAGTTFGIDFNPTVDRVRVVNSAGQNFRINPNNGAFVDGNATAANLNMDGGINGPTNTVQETAYTNSAPNATMTTQFTLDSTTDAFCIQNPPNNGTQTACQTLSSAVDGVFGFDITPANTALAVLRLAGQTSEVIASIDVANGMVGTIGAFTAAGVNGIAVQEPAAMPFVGLSADGTQLARFSGAAPGTATSVTITGVAAGEVLVGIDFRPQTGQLYGLGVAEAVNTATLYLLDPQTGAATAVGAIGQIAYFDAAGNPVDLPPAASGYGFDFNPTVDRVRVTTGTGLNFRVNPNNGAPVDGNLNNTTTPPALTNTDGLINGASGVSGAAYTNSFGQSLTGGVTSQYVIDAGSDQLFIQNPPNAGTLTVGLAITVGGAPLDFSAVSGFDIPSNVRVTTSGTPPVAGSAFAALTVAGAQRLYSIDLVTGAATDLGALAAPLAGLATGQTALQ